VPDARAGPSDVAVRRVFSPRLAQRTQIDAKLAPPKMQKRTKNRAGLGMNAAQARDSRSAQNMRKDGFALVVRRVGNGNTIESSIGNEPIEVRVARAPRRVFHIGPFLPGLRRYIFVRRMEWQAEMRGKLVYKRFVAIRSLPAQFMIEVHNGKNDAELLPQLEEQAQKRDRVRST
jgi:hypothetical protein